jgi:hypothetical protein
MQLLQQQQQQQRQPPLLSAWVLYSSYIFFCILQSSVAERFQLEDQE